MGYYCGMDLASKKTAICIISEGREVIWEGEVCTKEEALGGALSPWENLKCVVEAAPLAEWMCGVVEGLGHKIDIVCPRKAKAVLSAQGKKKTDRRDARSLAELCRSGWYEPIHRKSEKARELRSYMTARKQLVEGSTALVSSIRGILRAHGVKLDGGSDEQGFEQKVKAAMKGLPVLARSGIRSLLEGWRLLHKEQKRMYRQLDKIALGRKETAALLTIPGVGPATAVAFVATIDDPKRFQTEQQVSSYLGLVPSVYQSGDTEYRGKITKQGDCLLRWLLVEAAHILLSRSKTDCPLRRWGLRLQEAKGVGKARVAVARKLACLMWQMWQREETFRTDAALATS